MTSRITTHKGSCHCGAVHFEVDTDLGTVSRCNCTICMKTAITGSMVKPEALRVVSGEDLLTAYGRKEALRFFCSRCGINCFGRGDIPELGGPFASFNVNALDDVDPNAFTLIHWDGRHDNWQAGPHPAPWPIATASG